MQCPTNSSAKPSTILTNTTVSSWTSDTTYAGYSYRGDITHSGITSDTSATVVFANAEASSGNYAPFAVTSTGKISVYSKVNTSITIPTIRIDATLNYFNLKGTVGDDTKPIKIVNGECVAVANALATQSALNGKENTISPTASQIGLGNYGFTYGSVYKIKINDKIYTYSVYDGNKSSTGKVYIDTSVKSGYVQRGVLIGTNATRVSGLVGCDSSGVYIDVLVAGEWLMGQVTIVLP